MTPELLDALSPLLFAGLAFGFAGLGVLALPWSDAELDETAEAVQQGWQRLDGLVARWLHRAATGQATSAVAAVPATAARPFDPPTVPHAHPGT